MKVQIQEQLSENIDRLKNLVSNYESCFSGEGSGRRACQNTDVLREATVLLKASLEELFCNLAHHELPAAAAVCTVATRADDVQAIVRDQEGRGNFDTRAIREMLNTAGADPKKLRRTIRRTELRQIVPLADSTIYEMERRGEFPQRFFLTPRCVVWDLAEVMAWLESRRHGGDGVVTKAPAPDYRLRTRVR
jgi:prophage regulatory protein